MSQNQASCPSCGAAVSSGAQFCRTCGKPISAGLQCAKCGRALSPGARFCRACGTPVGSVGVTPEGVPQPRPAPSALPSSMPPPMPHPGAAPVPARKGSRAPLFVIGGLAVVCVCLVCGLGGIGLIGHGGGTGDDSSQGTTASPSAGYAPRPLVPGSTSPETVEVTSSPDKVTALALSDGTRVEIPASSAAFSVALSRATNTLTLSASGMQTSGSMRVLSFDAIEDPALFIPTITIPAREAGEIDLDTINIARVGDLIVDGQVVKDQLVFLPVHRDDQGNLMARDTSMPDAAFRDATGNLMEPRASLAIIRSLPGALALRPARQIKFHNEVKYAVSTFQGSLNWAIEPKLLRMIPDGKLTEKRRVAPDKPISEEDKKELSKPVVNVVILVHGHNEAERAGFETRAYEPWGVRYKRDVWTFLYDTFIKEHSAQQDCTIFYEFIYPTYRPIFTPGDGETLGQSFARLVEADPQIKQLVEKKEKFNFFIVAHSMGGLVSRAGIRLLNDDLRADLQQLVTWGTPHHGSPLVSLRFALGAVPGYDFRPGDATLPTSNITLLTAYQSYLAGKQLDTPGTRDLRWDNGLASNPRELALADILQESAAQVAVNEKLDTFDLNNGTLMYNQNLRIFNENDPYRLSDKYTFLYGVTSKRAELSQVGWFRKVWRFRSASKVTQGATLMPILVKNASVAESLYGGQLQGATDGAIPLASMAGIGIAPATRAIYLGDVDHEEYFGAPDESSAVSAANEKNARLTATKTFDALEISSEGCKCPKVEVTLPKAGAFPDKGQQLAVEAALQWPAELEREPGLRIKQAEALFYIAGTKNEKNLGALKVVANGKMTGSFNMPDIDQSSDKFVVRATLIDGTMVESVPNEVSRPCDRGHRSDIQSVKITVNPDEILNPKGKYTITATATGIPKVVTKIVWEWDGLKEEPWPNTVIFHKDSGVQGTETSSVVGEWNQYDQPGEEGGLRASLYDSTCGPDDRGLPGIPLAYGDVRLFVPYY